MSHLFQDIIVVLLRLFRFFRSKYHIDRNGFSIQLDLAINFLLNRLKSSIRRPNIEAFPSFLYLVLHLKLLHLLLQIANLLAILLQQASWHDIAFVFIRTRNHSVDFFRVLDA